MKLYIILISLLGINKCFAQDISFDTVLSWDSLKEKDYELIDKFIKMTPSEFEYYKLNKDYTPKIKDLINDIHTLDLDNDGLDDIIFDGQTGGELREILIFLNKGSSFVKVFSDWQRILNWHFTDDVLSEISIVNWGCCAETNTTSNFYKVTNPNNSLTFTLLKTFQYIEDTVLPDKYWPIKKNIKILNNDYNLRSSPVVNDTTTFYYQGEPTIGNSVGKIKKDALAIALADSTDDTGRIWYFVAVYPEYKLKETLFYDADEKSKRYKCGWLSNRFVEIKE